MLHRIATLASALGVALVFYAILFVGTARKIFHEFMPHSMTVARSTPGDDVPWWLVIALAAWLSFFALEWSLDFFRAQRRHWPGRCRHCGAKRLAERRRCVFCGTVFADEAIHGG